MTDRERKFELFMKLLYDRSKSEAGYNATTSLQMLGERGAVETARFLLLLLRQPKVSSGCIGRRRENSTMRTVLCYPAFLPSSARRYLCRKIGPTRHDCGET